MSYKVQRPLPTAPGAPATAARDALPSPAWWGARGVPRSLCPGSIWPNPAPMALGENAGRPQPSPHQRGAEHWGSRRQPVPRCGAGGGSRIPPRFGGVPVPALPELLQCPPTSHRIPVATCSGKGCRPRGVPQIHRVGGPRAASPAGFPASPPPTRSVLFPAALRGQRARRHRCRRVGCQGAAICVCRAARLGRGGHCSPQPPHLGLRALQGWVSPKMASSGLSEGGGLGRGPGPHGEEGRTGDPVAHPPAFLCGVAGLPSPPQGYRGRLVLPPP